MDDRSAVSPLDRIGLAARRAAGTHPRVSPPRPPGVTTWSLPPTEAVGTDIRVSSNPSAKPRRRLLDQAHVARALGEAAGWE
jgi:hypothetical protein